VDGAGIEPATPAV